MKKYWTSNEINFLKENFSDKKTNELSVILKRTSSSIIGKAKELKLKKSKEHIGKMISKRNKILGRDLTFEKLKEIASQYRTRGELQIKDPSVYRSARLMGILDEICLHMISPSYSTPQLILNKIIKKLFNCETLYNDRRTLKPFEIDVFMPKYNIGFEYNGKGWHNTNINDNLKIKEAKRKDVKLFIIHEKNRNYELDIKNQLIDFLYELNLMTNNNFNNDDILKINIGNIYEEIYIFDDLLKITSKYISYPEFRKNEPTVYDKLKRLKKLDLATSHMCCRIRKRNIQEVTDKINKYTRLKDLLKYDYGTYLYVKKNKLEALLINLKKRVKD